MKLGHLDPIVSGIGKLIKHIYISERIGSIVPFPNVSLTAICDGVCVVNKEEAAVEELKPS